MSRRLLFSAAAACAVLTALGCSSSSDSAAHAPRSTRSSESDGGASSALSVELNDGVGLEFTSGAPQEVRVQVTPAGIYSVRFSLVGDAADAFLDKSEDQTDDQGRTSVLLTPPSSGLSFALRAAVSGATAEVPVSSLTNATTIDVVPAYGGKRNVSLWIASVSKETSCSPDGLVPLADGTFIGQAMAGQSVPVPNVPVGKPLRVTVRAGHFASGCIEVPALRAGERRSVPVTVTDRPLQMNGVTIPVVLGIDDTQTFAAAWSKLAATMTSGVVPQGKTDASALLDAMGVAIPYLYQDAFSLGRSVHDWDERVNGVLAAGAGTTAIRDTLGRWLGAARTGLSKEAISGTLSSPQSGSGTASMSVTSVAGAAAADVGFPGTVSLTWTSAPSDQVLFGGSASWKPSRLAAALAENAATKEVPSASTLPEALAAVISCDDVAAALARDSAEVSRLSCDASCLSSRCRSALESMWSKAQDAVVARAAVHIAASGTASVDDSAHPVGFSGSWIGDASFGAGATNLGGSAQGMAAAPR